VSFAYDADAVLAGVDLSVDPGEVVAILGPNGSGKTTLLRLVGGLRRPSSGRIELDGRDLATIPPGVLARQVASVPQETHLAFDYTVLEIALMGRYPHLGAFELEGPADVAIAREMLALTGTAALESRTFTTLSGGEKQRVVIASALAQFEDPRRAPGGGERRLLLLDEPTASLDPGYQFDIAAIVERLAREGGIAVLISTHDLNFAAGVADRLVLLRGGRVLAAGDARAVLTRENVRRLYDLDADVSYHPEAARVTVVPLRRHRPAAGRPR
jgi:iron complex transport system ATP-binding protein